MVNELFDKIIKIELFSELPSKDGNATSEYLDNSISCPETGRKPLISLKGQFITSTEVKSIELRITNLYSEKSFADYKFLRITAGYKNKLQSVISGEIFNAYIETPPPDSVTVFEVLIASLSDWTTAYISKNFEKNISLRTLLTECCNLLGLKLNYYLNQEYIVPVAVNFHGLVKDALRKIKEFYPQLILRPEGDILYVYHENEGTGIIHNLDFITSAKKDAAGFTIIAPWLPILRPGDSVKLNPKYYKQSYGGQNVSGTDFQTITIDFDFDTDKKNTMTLVTVEK